MLLRNLRPIDLVTGQAGDPVDLPIRDGLLASVACDRDELAGEEELDLAGRFVLPGLWDHHVHFSQWAMHRQRLGLPAGRSAEEVAGFVGEALADDRGTEPVVGIGFRDATWPSPPRRDLLDAVTGGRPVVLLSGDLHSVWANSAALRYFGVDHRTGHLTEAEAFELEVKVADAPDELLDDWVDQAARAAAELGVVGIGEMEMAWNPGSWCRRAEAQAPGLRVRAAVYPQDLERALAQGLRTGASLDPSGLVTMGPLKVIGDGSLTARTAWCRSPYAHSPGDDPCHRGAPNVQPDELVDLMARAQQGGLQCAIHAIGDAANEMVLAAFERTGAQGSIEHAQLAGPGEVAAMARLGVAASVQPSHLVDDAVAMDRLWGDRVGHAFPLAQMLSAGVELRLGSDAPVSPLHPWQAIQDAVLRAAPHSPSWHPEQALTLSQALLASTDGVRALVPGGRADLVVLDENPFERAPESLGELTSALTMVAGRITHSRL